MICGKKQGGSGVEIQVWGFPAIFVYLRPSNCSTISKIGGTQPTALVSAKCRVE